jgi:glycosyltransferase involved in cell wall biosynthesis
MITEVGIPNRKVVVVPNSVDTELFMPLSRGGPLFRRRWELGDGFVVLAPGRLVTQKDHATVIDAFSIIVAEQPSSFLVIAGSGPLERDLKRRAAPLTNHVRFVGELTREGMVEAMGAADVVCLMSRHEGMPNVVLEAMASGVAVVASAIDGTTEVLEDGGGGWLIPPGASEILARRLVELSNSPKVREELGRRGRRAAERIYSLVVNVDRHAALYETVIRSRYGTHGDP